MAISSTDLIEMWRNGDARAADELYRRYVDRLLKLLEMRLSARFQGVFDPEDVCQSAFGTIFRRLRKGEFQFVDDANVWKLLITVGLNKLRNRTRTPKRFVLPAAGECEVDAGEGFDGRTAQDLSNEVDPAAANVYMDLLEQLFSRLDSDSGKVLEMRLSGYKSLEIAQEIGYSEKWVQRRMNDIRRKLKTLDAEAA
jgi:RNA polymerase sigma factor (sigma-70 family)